MKRLKVQEKKEEERQEPQTHIIIYWCGRVLPLPTDEKVLGNGCSQNQSQSRREKERVKEIKERVDLDTAPLRSGGGRICARDYPHIDSRHARTQQASLPCTCREKYRTLPQNSGPNMVLRSPPEE